MIGFLSDGRWHRYCEIIDKTGLSTATVTKHLKQLEGLMVERRVDTESGEYPYPTYYRIIPPKTRLKIKGLMKDHISKALNDELESLELVKEEYCGGIDVILSEFAPRREEIDQMISEEIKSRPLLTLETLFTRLAFSRYSIDPLGLERETFPSLMADWMVNTVFLKCLKRIRENFTPETSYNDFVKELEEVYDNRTMLLFRYTSDHAFSQLKELGFFKEYYERLRHWVAKTLETTDYAPRKPSLTQMLGVKWGVPLEENIKKLSTKEGALSKEELIELYRKFWDRQLSAKVETITRLRRRLRGELMALVSIAENSTYYTLLSRFLTQ